MRDFVMDGFVQKQVEDRSTQTGRVVTRFSVNSPDYDRQSGQKTPHYFDIEYWHDPQDDKRGHIQEGALLMLWGRFKQDRWQDQQTGQNRSKVVFEAREVALIRAPRQQAAPQQTAYAPQPAYPQQTAYAPQQGHRQPPLPAQRPAYAQQPAPAQPYAPQPAPHAAPQPQAPRPAPQAAPQQAPAQAAPEVDVYDEDIPF